MQPRESYQAAERSPVFFKAVQQGHTFSNELQLLDLSVGASKVLIVHVLSAHQQKHFQCLFLFLFFFFTNPNCLMTGKHTPIQRAYL